MAERKALGQPSWRVATRLQSLSLPNMISMRLRRLYQRFSERVGVVPPVSVQPFDVWQSARQRPRTDVVAYLSSGDEKAERPPLTVADGVQLGGHAALGATDQAATLSHQSIAFLAAFSR